MPYSNKSIMSLPVSRGRQTSMRRRFIAFSAALFLIIFVSGSIAFVLLMGQFRQESARFELAQTVELERYRLEAEVKSDIAIVLKMSTSPVIMQYFLDPNDPKAANVALKEIEGYRKLFSSGSLFLVNDRDKKFFLDGRDAYTVNPDDPKLYWYNMTMYETERYNFNIDYDPHLKVTNIWINAPVFGPDGKALGILGTGMNLSGFINGIYRAYKGGASLYFFNRQGEITGARYLELVVNKALIEKELGRTGAEIMAGAKDLKDGHVAFFKLHEKKGVAALGMIPSLDWYVVAIHRFTLADTLGTGMTALFAIMMAVIFSVFAVFNIFLSRLLGPLYHMVKKIGQISSEWEFKPQGGAGGSGGEIDTLGEFLNKTIIDELTGIHNRRFFDNAIMDEINSLSRSEGLLSVLMIDIDFFKNYNDTYGHVMGDNCLRGVAGALSHCLEREGDFVARYGGEEFVVVLPNTDEDGARTMAEKLLNRVRDCCIPHERSDAAAIVTISIGGTTGKVRHPQDGSDYVKRADAALCKSKNNGRDQYYFEEI